jgi:outer membrane receptor protein involved in Fe transport
MFFTPFNAPDVSQSGFGLMNASLEVAPAAGPWRASVFVKNLGDTFYHQEIARSANIVGTIGWPGDPRTWGVEFGVKF